MKDLRLRLFARSFLLQAGFSDESRQALGFAWAIDPALVEAYASDPAELARARRRHLASFNAQPAAAGLILGVAARLEIRAAAGEAACAERAAALKAAMGASLSGSADAFFWGALRPLAAALAILVAAAGARLGLQHSLAFGAAAGLLAFNGPALAARWIGISRGLASGETAALGLAAFPVQAWIRGTRRAAAVLVAAAALSCLSLPAGGWRP